MRRDAKSLLHVHKTLTGVGYAVMKIPAGAGLGGPRSHRKLGKYFSSYRMFQSGCSGRAPISPTPSFARVFGTTLERLRLITRHKHVLQVARCDRAKSLWVCKCEQTMRFVLKRLKKD